MLFQTYEVANLRIWINHGYMGKMTAQIEIQKKQAPNGHLKGLGLSRQTREVRSKKGCL